MNERDEQQRGEGLQESQSARQERSANGMSVLAKFAQLAMIRGANRCAE